MRFVRTFIPGLAIGLALALLAYAAGWLHFGSPDPISFSAPRRESPPSTGADHTALRSELAGARKRIGVLEWELEQASTVAPAKQAASADAPATSAGSPEIPDTVRAAARTLNVSETALQAAYRLDLASRQRRPAPGALDALLAEGADGFKAVIALMRAGLRATWQKSWLEQTWQPGLEQLLIDCVEDPQFSKSRGIALSFLSIADTQRTRDYLVKKVQDDPTPNTVYSAAQSLGALKEPRGANAIGLNFAQPGWEGVRGTILYNLGEMGGADARRILISYLQMEKADQLAPAIKALARIDPAAAKLQATRLLAREGAEFLHYRDRATLKRIVEQE